MGDSGEQVQEKSDKYLLILSQNKTLLPDVDYSSYVYHHMERGLKKRVLTTSLNDLKIALEGFCFQPRESNQDWISCLTQLKNTDPINETMVFKALDMRQRRAGIPERWK